MKSLQQFFLGLLSLVAWTQIGISGEMLQVPRERFTAGHFAYPALLIISVIYLHWLFRVYLMPVSRLDREQRQRLKQQALARYSKGFLAGTVALGYLLLVLYAFGFLAGARDQPAMMNLVWPGLFLIALGTLAEARGLVLALMDGARQEAKPAVAPETSHWAK